MSTIATLLAESCRNNAGRTALAEKVGSKWHSISYAELWREVERVSAGLQARQFKPETKVAILAPSSPMWVATYLGVLHAGGVVVPIDKDLKSSELRHVLADCDTPLIFTTEAYLEPILELYNELPELERIVLIDRDLTGNPAFSEPAQVVASLVEEWHELKNAFDLSGEQVESFEKLASRAHELLLLPKQRTGQDRLSANLFSNISQVRQKLIKKERLLPLKEFVKEAPTSLVTRAENELAIILYTSGTTGRSKGAMLSHGNIVSNIRGVHKLFDVDNTIHTLSFLPINHVFEQVCGILLPLALGGRITFAESLKKLGENVREIQPTFFLGVPAVYRLFLDRIQKNIASSTLSRSLYQFALTRNIISSKVRKAFGEGIKFVSGGAALDPEVQKGFQDLGFKIYQGYGITETSPVISAESPTCSRRATVGTLLEGVEVRIDNPNDEGVGEIIVRGPNVMLGYYKNSAATEEVLQDGWYRTGDLGSFSEDGFLSICGRVKNLIVTPNGKNVYPEEIEHELLKSPFIAEAMVYGHKISSHAEEVYAMIYPDQEALDHYAEVHKANLSRLEDVEKLIRNEIQAISKELADYKRIKRFTLRDEEFPKTTTRKIKRFVVEADIASEK